jgi:hypothetical protein
MHLQPTMNILLYMKGSGSRPSLVMLLAVCLAFTVRTDFAQGGPPMLTDDPGTPGNRRLEINTALTTDKNKIGYEFEAPLVDINYGIGDRVQLKLELAWLVLREHGAKSKTGLSNTLIGIKWRFLDENRHGISMSTYPQLEFNNPTSSVRRGIVDSGANFLLPVELTRKLGPVEANLELGYRFVQHEKDQLLYGLAFGREISERFELMAEIHGEPNRDFSDDNRLINFGARYKINEHHTFLFSAGRSLRRSESGAPTFIMYAGLQFNY